MTPPPGSCPHDVHWLDIDITEHCRRAEGHRGHHFDGLWFWTDDGIREPRDPEADTDD